MTLREISSEAEDQIITLERAREVLLAVTEENLTADEYSPNTAADDSLLQEPEFSNHPDVSVEPPQGTNADDAPLNLDSLDDSITGGALEINLDRFGNYPQKDNLFGLALFRIAMVLITIMITLQRVLSRKVYYH